MLSEPEHDKTNKITHVPIEHSDHTGQIGIILGIHHVLLPIENTVTTDQNWQMPRLILVCAGCTGHFNGFIMLQLDFLLYYEGPPLENAVDDKTTFPLNVKSDPLHREFI